MRLFIAVASDEQVQKVAAAVIARLSRAKGNFRWVDPCDMHTTLRYLGPTPKDKIPGIRDLMTRAAREIPPFELVYGGVGAFNTLEEARVIWIGLSEGSELMACLADLLGRDDPRPYAPHLTLGRNRKASAPDEFISALQTEPALNLRRPVKKISLYASRPTSFGHAYDILYEVNLGAAVTV